MRIGPYWRNRELERHIAYAAGVKANETLRDYLYDPTFTQRSKTGHLTHDGQVWSVTVTVTSRPA